LFGASALTFAGVSRLSIGSEADSLRSSCAPACPADDYDRLVGKLGTANAALAAGIGSLALATIAWFVFAPKGSQENLASPR
jgi:hypothetical protein